ncbi:MAG: tetratricopeptide repeat protein, partial [Gemmataceae bacterium]
KPYLLSARIADADGDSERAIERYKAALDRGEANPEVVTRLVDLLRAQRKDAEIAPLLARYREMIPLNAGLAGAAASAAMRGAGSPEEAAEAALRSLPEKSPDPGIHLVRGQVLWSAKRLPEAEKALRRAVELGPTKPETHLALVGFLKEALSKSAESEINAARAALPPETALLTVASCREITGEREKAEEGYAAALKARPNDPKVLRAVATWMMRRGMQAEANRLLGKLIEQEATDPKLAAWARRTLAVATAATGDYEQYTKALAMIAENARGGALSAEDQRARALIQARQPRDRREAIRTLEESFARIQPTASESFFLATLLAANNEWPRAKERLLRLLSTRDGQNPGYFAYFIEQLAQNGQVDEARPWLDRLKKEEPGSLRTVGIEARVKLAQKQPVAARELLAGYARSHGKDARQLLAAARLMESLRFPEDAEPAYRECARLLADRGPLGVLPLVQFLGRRGKVTEALELCDKVRDKLPAETVGEVAVTVLRDGKPTPEQCQKVAGWIREVKAKRPDQVFFDLALANIADLAGDAATAIATYKGVIGRDPRNVLALNNLAVLLALKDGKAEEGLAMIDKAIGLAGPQPGLLDSKGIVLIAKGDAKEAAAALEEATQMAPDPTSLARLAVAFQKAGERRPARDALRKAKAAGFELASLHPLERPGFEAAEKDLSR